MDRQPSQWKLLVGLARDYWWVVVMVAAMGLLAGFLVARLMGAAL